MPATGLITDWSPLRSLHRVVNKKGNKLSDVGFQEVQDGICGIPPCLVVPASLRCGVKETRQAGGAPQAQAGPVGTSVLLHKPATETCMGEILLGGVACKRALRKDGSREQANRRHPLYWKGLLHRDVECYYIPLCPPLKEKNLNVSVTKGFGGLLIHIWEMTDDLL